MSEKSLSVRKPLETPLAKPWHYRRDGVYYLRIRPVGPKETLTISLRSKDKAIAMSRSKDLQDCLKRFHLDNPSARWAELKAKMLDFAEDLLATPMDWIVRDKLEDARRDLERIDRTVPMTFDQSSACSLGIRILRAAEARYTIGTGPLRAIIEELSAATPPKPVEVPVSAPGEPLTFRELSCLYMAELAPNVKESSMRDVKATCETLSSVLGELDLRGHTREDLIGARTELLQGRKASTVNKILIRLSSVLEWGVQNGKLTVAYAKRLKITKGADSAREAFSQDQVKEIMAYCGTLGESEWERWAISLGCITGARIAEIRQLLKSDVVNVSGAWTISITDEDGKELKNKQSVRSVPLIDGAYGFDLAAFLRFKEAANESGLFTLGAGRFSEVVNTTIRSVLKLEADRALSFHSLRHSLASLLKAEGVPLGIAQAVLGHSSNSITFDLYGGSQQVAIHKMEEALREAFSVTK